MAKLLYLVHRLPFPPNKGDKLGSFHMMQQLLKQHTVHLGTFVDDPDDWQHVSHLRTLCAEVFATALTTGPLARLASLRGLALGEALSLTYYRNERLKAWIRDTMARNRFDAVVVFSGAMMQYVSEIPDLPVIVNFADVDSAKWSDFAAARPWPMSWLYRRESQKLLAFEQASARRALCSFFVTEHEAKLFQRLSPGLDATLDVLCNGVDSDRFSPDPTRSSPFPVDQQALVFTGAMDYWPNVDAVCWFAQAILPELRKTWPQLHFHIVGRSPVPAVQALANEFVHVSGTVPDVRPYLQFATLCVAPLRLARGLQNKVLEAMAMGQPVVAATPCVQALVARDGEEILSAQEPADYVRHIDALLRDSEMAARIGAAGRARVLASYSWDAHLAALDPYLDGLPVRSEMAA